MQTERLDCGWCGSARSIEYGICQVCLMEYSTESRVIRLPREKGRAQRRSIVLHDAKAIGAAEKS